MKNKYIVILSLALMSVTMTATAGTQEEANVQAQANNPLANMKAFNVHNYYIGDLTESKKDANQLWMRYAQPVSIGKTNWLVRGSLPINSFPTPPDNRKETGIGDFNIFAAYLLDIGKPGVTFGVGPLLNLPTATVDALGSEKYSAGIANVLFNASSRKFQYGYLLTWQGSFAGNDKRNDVSLGAFQPFGMMQLGKGTYLRTTGIWFYNFDSDSYSVPLGIGVGQVFKKGKTVFNVFIEPQYSVFDDGPGLPKWQVFVGLNTQFYK